MDKEVFGEMVAVYREKLGLSQQKLADLLGVSRGYIGQIERGMKMPSEEVFTSLLMALKIPPTEVFPMDILQEKDPEVALLLDLIAPSLQAAGEVMTPEQMLHLAQYKSNQDELMEKILTASTTIRIDSSPDGWSRLNKGDRKLVQEIINRLLKTRRYEEGGDRG